MSEKMKKSDKVKMSSRPKNDRLNKSDIKKQTWRAEIGRASCRERV